MFITRQIAKWDNKAATCCYQFPRLERELDELNWSSSFSTSMLRGWDRFHMISLSTFVFIGCDTSRVVIELLKLEFFRRCHATNRMKMLVFYVILNLIQLTSRYKSTYFREQQGVSRFRWGRRREERRWRFRKKKIALLGMNNSSFHFRNT